MIPVPAIVPALAVAAGLAQTPAMDSLRALARDAPDSVLVERVRRRPVDARLAMRSLLAGGVLSDSSALVALATAGRLARAYAVAWEDSFFIRQVARFRALSSPDRQASLAADSIRRAGVSALGSRGPGAAIAEHRESLRRFEALADTAGMAAALASLGTALRVAQEYDSAAAYLARSSEFAERVRDYATLGTAIHQLGAVSEQRGEFERATELFTRARSLRERIGDLRAVASVDMSLAIVADGRGDLPAARRAYEASLAAIRAAGSDDSTRVLYNLGNVAMRAGNFAEAETRMGQALTTARKRGDRGMEQSVLTNLGYLHIRRGAYPAAVAALQEAVEVVEETGPVTDEIEVRLALAQALARDGALSNARAEADRAADLVRRGPVARQAVLRARVALERAQLALRFNQYLEAEQLFLRAQTLADTAGDAFLRNRAQVGMAFVLYRRENYRRAQELLEQVLASGTLRDRGNEAIVLLMAGRAALRGGDTANAARMLSQALEKLHALGDREGEAEALGLLGELQFQAGRPIAAESLYRRAVARLGARPEPGLALLLHRLLGGAMRRRGALADAAQELLDGIARIERVAGSVPLADQRSEYLADKWGAYVDLTHIEVQRGKMQAAFETSERLRARQMLDFLARGRIVARHAVADLSAREENLRRRMGDLSRELDALAPDAHRDSLRDPARPSASAGDLENALRRAQEQYDSLLIEMRQADPAYTALVRAEIASSRTVMAALAPEEALLEYLVGDSMTIVFVVTADTLAAFDANLNHAALTAQVDFARTALASSTEARPQDRWRPPLRRLYRHLIEPVEASGVLAGKRRLIIAPHAELHYLPFAALVRPGPPEQLLVERYVVEYVPSASVWLRLRERPRPAQRGGVLALAPRTAALPGSRTEVTAIRRTYGTRAQALIGPQATENTFRALATQPEIIHLATFGVLNKHNPLFSYVQLNPGGEDDGRLEVHEVFGLTLQARLVVLSACQTGVGAGTLADVPPGDDWIGLVQGFLYAGASNVLATLWPVADVATARLMERFYRELATGRSEAEALAVAQQAAIRSPRTAAPFFWAGFTLVRGR